MNWAALWTRRKNVIWPWMRSWLWQDSFSRTVCLPLPIVWPSNRAQAANLGTQYRVAGLRGVCLELSLLRIPGRAAHSDAFVSFTVGLRVTWLVSLAFRSERAYAR